jgi:general secretion pathway protein I
VLPGKVQHWRGFPGKNGWKGAPMLGFNFSVRRRSSGFSLLEILVAFTLLAVALGVLMQVFSRGVNGASLSDQYARAAMLGESKLAAVGIDSALQEGDSNGRFDDEFAWSLSVTPYVDPTPPDPAVTAALGATDVDSLMSVRLYNVVLSVTFTGADARPRVVTFNTIQLAPRLT